MNYGKTTANYDDVLEFYAEHPDPFSVLGMHHLEHENSIVVRAFAKRQRNKCCGYFRQQKYKMDLVDEKGFRSIIRGQIGFFKYI